MVAVPSRTTFEGKEALDCESMLPGTFVVDWSVLKGMACAVV